MFVEEIFPGMGILKNVPAVCTCFCVCTSDDPKKNDSSEDSKGEEG